jgi:hypothetical protein
LVVAVAIVGDIATRNMGTGSGSAASGPATTSRLERRLPGRRLLPGRKVSSFRHPPKQLSPAPAFRPARSRRVPPRALRDRRRRARQ